MSSLKTMSILWLIMAHKEFGKHYIIRRYTRYHWIVLALRSNAEVLFSIRTGPTMRVLQSEHPDIEPIRLAVNKKCSNRNIVKWAVEMQGRMGDMR